ncbi:GSK-3-binding protein-like [Neodiprion pinetum]|uniref:GSK-3-binding protein-like n=1 Tax=Neodiprion lecontei TaxID=441921 RepID=A0A6J0BHJ0_NEOLC|nr:GSK-3-binding protein-like [Neodiprion lecontei]XP_046471989.1 GSK-3-binding protein-like [Neodiprion pinetum]XP_046607932.1 GSK-3-binding protein-like [Neodiprion virginianus]
MPSAAEETTYLNLIDVMPRREATTTQEFLTRDVDLLVSQIKENLRLSGFKAKSSFTQKSRPSPYRIPSRSWADPAATCEACRLRVDATEDERQQSHHHYHHHHHHLHHQHHHHHHHSQKRSSTNVDDPYELLQVLLREGGLIKEAVKRLQASLQASLQANLEELDNPEEESVYERKPYFYDSEDEPRPVIPPLEL